MAEELMVNTVWSDWITEKFAQFKKARGKGGKDDRGALMEFARLFSAPHQVVAAWMREGATPPRKADYRARLVELYGAEALEALGMPVPKNFSGKPLNENRALDILRAVPDEHQEELLDLMEHYLFKHGFRRIK